MVLTPAVVPAPLGGVKLTVTTQEAPGARVVCPKNCPLPAGPQVESMRRTVNWLAFAPPSAACVIPVSGTLPLFVSVNICIGHKKPQPRVAEVVQVGGASNPLTTGGIPVPLRPTGEPVTGTLAAMVTVPAAGPAVGENVTVIVQFCSKAVVRQGASAGASSACERRRDSDRNAGQKCVARVVQCQKSLVLVEPTATLPKLSGPPVTLATAAAGTTNSTAPTSNTPAWGRVVPKKSVLGAGITSPNGRQLVAVLPVPHGMAFWPANLLPVRNCRAGRRRRNFRPLPAVGLVSDNGPQRRLTQLLPSSTVATGVRLKIGFGTVASEMPGGYGPARRPRTPAAAASRCSTG